MKDIETSDLNFAAFIMALGYHPFSVSHNERGTCFWLFAVEEEELYLDFLRGRLVPANKLCNAIRDCKKMALSQH